MSRAIASTASAPRVQPTEVLVWVAGAITLAAATIALWLSVAVFTAPEPWGPGTPLEIPSRWLAGGWSLVLASVGLLILVRRPGNRIGRLTLALAFVFAAGVIAATLMQSVGGQTSEFGRWMFLVGVFVSATVVALVFSLLLLFPDGHLPSHRWRPVGWAIVAWWVLFIAAAAASPVISIGQGGSGGHGPNPAGGVPGPIGDLAAWLLLRVIDVGFPLLFLAVGAAAVVRFVKSRGVERQQLKWFAYAAALAFVSLIPVPLANLFSLLALNGLAIAIAIAVLRYRLYDIDLLIKRTVVYGATTAAIAATFWLGLIGLQGILGRLTAGSEPAVAAATLVSFALFQPIRTRVQGAVDRRFDRSRYDAARTLDAFADQLRDEVDLDTLRADLLGAVSRTMAPTYASLWLRGAGA